MFTTNYHFTEILEWFNNSNYEFLMSFLPSCDTRDRELENYFILNQYHINELTGGRIAFVIYDYNKGDIPIENITDYELPPNAMRFQINLTKEIREHYSFAQYNLPALILISRIQQYTLFPISSGTDLDSYFASISIVTSFINDYQQVERGQEELMQLDLERTHMIDECKNIEREIHHIEESDFNRIISKLNQCIKKIHNHKDFIAQNEYIQKYYHKLFEQCERIKELTSRNDYFTNGIHEIDRVLSRFDEEKNIILSNYENRLNDIINVINGKDILLRCNQNYSQGLKELLAIVKEKNISNNNRPR